MGISREEALDCFQSDDLIGIGMEADAVRRKLHPENAVTYSIEAVIDHGVSDDAIFSQIKDAEESGATVVTLQGKIVPSHTVMRFESLFRDIKGRFPSLGLHSLSATEIIEIAGLSDITVRDTIARLRDAGLDSIPGNDAVHSPDWLAVHRAAHGLGLQTTAGMVADADIEARIGFLAAVRQLQEETGGFAAFLPSRSEQQASLQYFEGQTAVEYLKTLAISRMFLDNIEHIQSDLEAAGPKVLQVSFRFGSNDGGSALAAEETLRQIIRDAGFKPIQRDRLYRVMLLN
jgi:cyclic dehypoxanthinyl futalosine synthase